MSPSNSVTRGYSRVTAGNNSHAVRFLQDAHSSIVLSLDTCLQYTSCASLTQFLLLLMLECAKAGSCRMAVTGQLNGTTRKECSNKTSFGTRKRRAAARFQCRRPNRNGVLLCLRSTSLDILKIDFATPCCAFALDFSENTHIEVFPTFFLLLFSWHVM